MRNPDNRVQPRALISDRDGTDVHGVPHDGDPRPVHLVDGATGPCTRSVPVPGPRTPAEPAGVPDLAAALGHLTAAR
ncbi:hypothetical protein [Kineococcus aurantiacus]|uniref:hypothetical protein n=1 Tax=Kineococcus aurantiacus TaxID=37633 RepID=UPI0015CEE815|nr:hypothetical protein [Kineococcus aurantiacus]